MRRHAEEIEAFRTAIRLKPDFAIAYYNLAETYITLGDRAEAVRAYQTLRRLDPDLAEKLRRPIYGE